MAFYHLLTMTEFIAIDARFLENGVSDNLLFVDRIPEQFTQELTLQEVMQRQKRS